MSTSTAVPGFVSFVLRTLSTAGFEGFLVGGCVRDALLGRKVHDYDIATNAKPEQVTSLFETVLTTGLKHGTVTVMVDHQPIEVTTYRTDGQYTDGRHPDNVQFARHITDDLSRRDFTINAMAMDIAGTLVDPFHGQTDVMQKRIRAVGTASERLSEDSLRILRGLRFAAELGFSVDAETLEAMYNQARNLKAISSERVGQELRRIASANWWIIADLLASGPWLECTNPNLKDVKTALRGLLRYRGHADKWYILVGGAADNRSHELADSEPLKAEHRNGESQTDKRIIGFLTTVMSSLPARAEALASAFQHLGWPKRLCRQALDAVKLVKDDMRAWNKQKWRQMLFEFPQDTVKEACALTDWYEQVVGGLQSQQETCLPTLNSFREHLSQQPLFRLNDLAISGHDIACRGAAGPVIGQIKRTLAKEVLQGVTKNDKSVLLQRTAELVKETDS